MAKRSNDAREREKEKWTVIVEMKKAMLAIVNRVKKYNRAEEMSAWHALNRVAEIVREWRPR